MLKELYRKNIHEKETEIPTQKRQNYELKCILSPENWDRKMIPKNKEEISPKIEKDCKLTAKKTAKSKDPTLLNISQNLVGVQIRDFKVIRTLGLGRFGRVDLVQVGSDPTKSYAIKSLSKSEIVKSYEERHIIQEKNILLSCDNPHIIHLFTTYKDSRFVYFLMEASLGGELWTKLRNKKRFSEETARFCLGCVVLAIEYLHSKSIVHRDIKPENLTIDSRGYIKMIDFGFAKRIPKNGKTWTFCGTPEYMAPEIIICKGYDLSVDYWSLGILIFILLTGRLPFVGKKKPVIYRKILNGIDSIKFPKKLGSSARNFMISVCKLSPVERLGYKKNNFEEIKNHSLFQDFDWNGLSLLKLKSNLVPAITSPTDTRYFDKFPPRRNLPEEEFSGWDDEF